MSSFFVKAKHPKTGKVEDVVYMDDYYGKHEYGVKFPNGDVFRDGEVEQVETTQEAPKVYECPDKNGQCGYEACDDCRKDGLHSLGCPGRDISLPTQSWEDSLENFGRKMFGKTKKAWQDIDVELKAFISFELSLARKEEKTKIIKLVMKENEEATLAERSRLREAIEKKIAQIKKEGWPDCDWQVLRDLLHHLDN